jgi:oligoendopeptidase F
MKKILYTLFTLALALLSCRNVSSQTRDRSTVDLKYIWKLEDIYATDNDWKADKDRLMAEVPRFETYKGKLGSSSGTLQEFLDLYFNFYKQYSRVYSYASMKSDQDLDNNTYMSMMQELRQADPTIGAAISFVEPEILSIGKEKIDLFLKENQGLKVYSMYLNELYRQQKHVLSEKEEKIIAQASAMTQAPYSIYSVFSNNELPYPKVVLSNGDTVLVNNAGYNKYRASANRKDRELVFNSFWSTMSSFEGTFAEQLLAGVNTDIFIERVRNYSSALESSLDRSNIPVSVYHSLIDNVNKNLPTFYRYLNLRKRLLNVDTLKYSDIYAPVSGSIDLEYTYDEARNLVINALAPLGADYQNTIRKAFDERWLDIYPTTGKRSGAYSNGSAYDVHPFMLLNFNGKYDDVSTMAHELGHTMQSYLSNKNQPYPLADYPTFTAEVASTFNEALLNDYMVKKIKDDKLRLSLLLDFLDNYKGTLFRQTQFAEFELAIHEIAESGQPLTSDVLNKTYGDIIRKYYGHNQGICIINDLYTREWSFIPHFYYNFYVYQYATSFTASQALAEKILTGDKASLDKYLTFLSSGGSDYPINQLKAAGVDMTIDEPFNNAIALMNKIMDEVEVILKRMGK